MNFGGGCRLQTSSMATVYFQPHSRSLPERIAYGIVALALLVLGFFFLAAAVVAGVVFAGVIVVRYWWVRRKLRKAADREFITAEYTVVDREKIGNQPVDAGPHPSPYSQREKEKQ